MAIIVQKYGGTSVADVGRIKSVAGRVAGTMRGGKKVAVVVSAMAGETDSLIALARELSTEPDPRAVDLMLATGEQKSVAMLSLALRELGIESEAFLGHEAGFVTDANHGRARILRVEPSRVMAALDAGRVAIVAGFQGATEEGEITTIGRGGSDTSAVALAAALGAELCEIYTDVEGVLTADPRICENARIIPRISYEEMMELADAGAKVVHSRAVEVAAKYRVPLMVKSSFPSPLEGEGGGTRIVPDEEVSEGAVVSGITCVTGEAKVAIRRVPDKLGVTAKIFAPIARAGINVDLIIQNVSADGFTDLTFTCPKEDLRRAMTIAEAAAREVKAGRVEAAGDIAKISAVGLGMRSHAGVAHRMFAALSREGIGIQMIGTSEIKVSIVTDIRHAELAVRVLHDEFGLGGASQSA
ncbi:MAG: aspartate kinase [Pseudomonadota bacterium]